MQNMVVDVISKEEAIKNVEKALMMKLKNKELFNDILSKFTGVMNKEKIRFNYSSNGIEVLDLTADFGEKIIISFSPNMIKYDSVCVTYLNGMNYRKNFDISFEKNNDVSLKIEETEFCISGMSINGMIMKKISKQYHDNKLMYVHEYASDSFVHDTSVSSDTLIQANPRGFANKRVVRVSDAMGDNSFAVEYYASNEFGREVFDTMNVPYVPAGYRPCNKEIYDKFFLTLKK